MSVAIVRRWARVGKPCSCSYLSQCKVVQKDDRYSKHSGASMPEWYCRSRTLSSNGLCCPGFLLWRGRWGGIASGSRQKELMARDETERLSKGVLGKVWRGSWSTSGWARSFIYHVARKQQVARAFTFPDVDAKPRAGRRTKILGYKLLRYKNTTFEIPYFAEFKW